jgi:hypothetical protein
LPQDFSQNVVQPLLHFVVPESQYANSALCEHDTTRCVEFDSVSMLTAIELDNEAGPNTDEVDNIAVDRNLPAKLESAQAPCTQARPQQGFCIGLA